MALIWVIILGAGQGLLASVFGLGGGVFLVPLLPLLFTNISGVPEASFVALTCIGLNCLVNVVFFMRKNVIQPRVLFFALGGFIGALVFSYVFRNLSGFALQILLSVTILMILLKSILSKYKESKIIRPNNSYLVLGGMAVSGLSALIGVGSGVLTQMLLRFKSWFSLDKRTPLGNVLLTGVSFGAILYRLVFTDLNIEFVYDNYFNLIMGLFICGYISSIFGRRIQAKVSELIKLRVLQTLLVGLFVASLAQIF